MSDKVDLEIAKLQSEIANWPKDQKASFIRGIGSGIGLTAIVAEEAGFRLSEDKGFLSFVQFLAFNTPPVKRRKGDQQQKGQTDQLIDDIRELLRRAIATTLKMSKRTFDESLDAEDAVNKYLLTVVAIGNHDALDDAIRDIRIMRSIAGGEVDRETVRSEVEYCDETFPFAVAAITHFNELRKRDGFAPKDIWAYLRSNVRVDHEYGEELSAIDSRYSEQ